MELRSHSSVASRLCPFLFFDLNSSNGTKPSFMGVTEEDATLVRGENGE